MEIKGLNIMNSIMQGCFIYSYSLMRYCIDGKCGQTDRETDRKTDRR